MSRPFHYIHNGVNWLARNSAPYRCGAQAATDRATTNPDAVDCTDCLELMGRGVATPTPQKLHTPPRMVDENGLNDGVFLFHGTHSDIGGVMEVVPMATGNVEFTISANDEHQEGMVFNLSHLDRADLIRALLHDFHYSPERGGPNDG